MSIAKNICCDFQFRNKQKLFWNNKKQQQKFHLVNSMILLHIFCRNKYPRPSPWQSPINLTILHIHMFIRRSRSLSISCEFFCFKLFTSFLVNNKRLNMLMFKNNLYSPEASTSLTIFLFYFFSISFQDIFCILWFISAKVWHFQTYLIQKSRIIIMLTSTIIL